MSTAENGAPSPCSASSTIGGVELDLERYRDGSDFVEGFPKIIGKSVILTVVDRFSKSAHFIPLGHPLCGLHGLFRLNSTKLYVSSAFHPQTDGQSEVTHRIIVVYLRCLASDRPRSWLRWLPWAEYCYNITY
jgi:hypothetical protein